MSAETTTEKQKTVDKDKKFLKSLAVGSIALVGAGIPTAFVAGEAVAADQQARHDLVTIENIQITEGGNLDAAGTALSLSEKTLFNPADIDILTKTTSVQVPLLQDLDSQALASRAKLELEDRNLDGAVAGGMAFGGLVAASVGTALSLREKRKKTA